MSYWQGYCKCKKSVYSIFDLLYSPLTSRCKGLTFLDYSPLPTIFSGIYCYFKCYKEATHITCNTFANTGCMTTVIPNTCLFTTQVQTLQGCKHMSLCMSLVVIPSYCSTVSTVRLHCVMFAVDQVLALMQNSELTLLHYSVSLIWEDWEGGESEKARCCFK